MAETSVSDQQLHKLSVLSTLKPLMAETSSSLSHSDKLSDVSALKPLMSGSLVNSPRCASSSVHSVHSFGDFLWRNAALSSSACCCDTDMPEIFNIQKPKGTISETLCHQKVWL